MKYTWPLLFLVLSACLTGRRHVPHAPPERAARVVFPAEVPPEGRIIVQGNKVAAMMLALDAFLPQESVDSCLHQRASYGVSVAQGPEGVLLVRLVADEACARASGVTLDAETQAPVVDSTTYAVDIRTWRILSIQRDWRSRP